MAWHNAWATIQPAKRQYSLVAFGPDERRIEWGSGRNGRRNVGICVRDRGRGEFLGGGDVGENVWSLVKRTLFDPV